MKDEYVAHGVVLILVPLSVFLFLIIVLVKVLCFFLADQKQRRWRQNERNYGHFSDDATEGDETEAVVGVYFKIMEKVIYRTVKTDPNEIVDEESKN